MAIGADKTDLGFNVMFSYDLIAIFAIGVSKTFETLSLGGAFFECERKATRQFAMTNCLGVATYIQRLSSAGLRRMSGISSNN
jgi:hypothetical protein